MTGGVGVGLSARGAVEVRVRVTVRVSVRVTERVSLRGDIEW